MAAWVFDVDGCLVDSLTGMSLRPGAAQLLSDLRCQGCTIVLWSAGGADYAQRRAQQHGIDLLFDGFHAKSRRDTAGRYIPAFLATGAPAVFVDDRPEDLPLGARVVAVSPYLSPNSHDRALIAVAARVGMAT